MIYLGVIRAFGYLSPYLPSPELIPRMLFFVFVPLVSVYIIMNMYSREAAVYERGRQRDDITPGWVMTSVLSILIVWFTVGVFPIFPSVILTGSMEPGIMPGDIVLVEKTGTRKVEVGDIVMFHSGEEGEGIYITHRVIEKTSETGETLYKTKGDNNSVADHGTVNTGQIKGKVIAVVPYVGKLTLFLRGLLVK
jgi:signal peptidase